MRLLELLQRESKVSLRSLFFVAALAGLSNAMVLAVINVAAGKAAHHETSTRLRILFIIAVAFMRRNKELNRELHETMKRENRLFDTLTDILEGFKEVRLNRKRSDDVYDHFEEISHEATRLKIQTMVQISTGFILAQVA